MRYVGGFSRKKKTLPRTTFIKRTMTSKQNFGSRANPALRRLTEAALLPLAFTFTFLSVMDGILLFLLDELYTYISLGCQLVIP